MIALAKILLVFMYRDFVLCSTSKTSCSSVLGPQGVRRDWWTGLNGGFFLIHLKNDYRFKSNRLFSTSFQPNFDSPTNFGKFYGQRLSAYFIPKDSGPYTFVATCDSECEIALSSDETRAHKRTIINIDQNHRTKYNEWDRYVVQRSCPQDLHGNTIYYLEGLHSNYRDQDHVRLKVIYPGQNELQWIDKTQLVRYSDEELRCLLLKAFCGYRCGGHQRTIIREIDPKTKLCTMPVTTRAPLSTTTTATTTTPTTKEETTTSPTIIAVTTQSTTTVKSASPPQSTKVTTTTTIRRTTQEKTTTTKAATTKFTATTPKGPFLNITTKSISSTSIQVTWNVTSNTALPTISSYRLDYNENSSLDMYSTIISGDVFRVVLQGLDKYTLYCIRMLYIIEDRERRSDGCHYARTLEDLPSQSPRVQVRNKALTSLIVTWQPINKDRIHGKLLGYKISVTNMNDSKQEHEVIKTGSKTTYMTLSGVQKRSRYCVQVLVFTGKGDGSYSDCAFVDTWTDDFLPNMAVLNYTGTTLLNITWDILPGYLTGHVISYRLSYTISHSKGSERVEQASPQVIQVKPNTTQFTITGLALFSVYRLEVRPLTRNGLGLTTQVAYGATCRCQKFLKALWSPLPPYAVKTETGIPTGMIPKLLGTMIDNSCGFCYEHNQSKIIYQLKTNRKRRELPFDENDDVDFVFPIRKQDKSSRDDSQVYIPLLEVPGFAFLTSVKTKQEYATQVATSVFDCWPVLAISLAMTLLSGVILWVVEVLETGSQPRKNVFQGVTDSVWWSFITMTTVGYGDQIPRTTAGRFFAILWLFIGIVIVALLVGSITSSLSVKILKERFHVKRDKKIASVEDPLDYKVLMNVDERATTRTTYQDMPSLISALKNGKMEGIIVDMYIAGFRTDLFNGSWYKVSSILERKFYYGVSISGNAATLAKRFSDRSLKTYEVEMRLLQEEREKEKVSNQFHVQAETIRKDIDLLNPRTLIYQLTVFFCLTVLGCVIIVGIFFHSWKKNREREKQMKNDYDHREYYLKQKQELKCVVDNFYNQALATYLRLKIKHRRQKLEFLKNKKRKQHEVIWL